MGQVKKDLKSIKWSLLKYVPFCILLSGIGIWVIGVGTNELQTWYTQKYSDDNYSSENQYEITVNENGEIYYVFHEKSSFTIRDFHNVVFWIISYAQFVLMPVWVVLCIWLMGAAFYKRELEKPVKLLLEASRKITDNQLDFSIEYEKADELGQLCRSFEKMRNALYQNNQKMWRMLEERKNLNAVFSHDMRTPITVIKGYRDLLEKYIPSGEVSEEKTLQILDMMKSEIIRLEKYTQKMGSLQKLGDIIPDIKKTDFKEFEAKCREISDMLAGTLQISYKTGSDAESIRIDKELVLEVYENLVSNAVRFAESRLKIGICVKAGLLTISVEDDGCGFTREGLQQAAEPFYREGEKEENHFGLGLYISKTLCEKCEGGLKIENGGSGGKVTASFREPAESR